MGSTLYSQHLAIDPREHEYLLMTGSSFKRSCLYDTRWLAFRNEFRSRMKFALHSHDKTKLLNLRRSRSRGFRVRSDTHERLAPDSTFCNFRSGTRSSFLVNMIPEWNFVPERELHSEWKPEWLVMGENFISVPSSCEQMQRNCWGWMKSFRNESGRCHVKSPPESSLSFSFTKYLASVRIIRLRVFVIASVRKEWVDSTYNLYAFLFRFHWNLYILCIEIVGITLSYEFLYKPSFSFLMEIMLENTT